MLVAANRTVRILAASALGSLRLSRACPELINRLQHCTDAREERALARAIGRTGGQEAVGVLRDRLGGRSRASALLGLAYAAQDVDPAEFPEPATELLSVDHDHRRLALRAAGLQRASALRAHVVAGLNSRHPVERGAAARPGWKRPASWSAR